MTFVWLFGFFLVSCTYGEWAPCCVQNLGFKDMLLTGHALWEVGGGILFVSPGEFAGQHKKLPVRFVTGFVIFITFKLYMLALVGLPSLHSFDACMVYWNKGHPGEVAGKNMVRPLFLFVGFFCLVEILLKGFGVWFFWHLWIGRAKNPGPGSSHHLAIEVFNVGGWLTHGDLALNAGLDLLAVTEHRLIPAGVRSEWARLKSKGVVLSGRLLLKMLLMLVMLVLGLSV